MLLVAYDGTSFHGFAAQPAQRTVGGTLAAALGSVAGHDVTLTCAGRTDTGVHASGQVVHADVSAEALARLAGRALRPGMVLERLARSLSRQSGGAVEVLEARIAPDGFDARHSATARRYRYLLLRTPFADPLLRHAAWHVPEELDLPAMRIAADALLGEHDFACFCRQPPGESGPIVRRVLEASWAAVPGDGRLLCFSIAANAFCHQMVRSVVGTLVAAGRGRIRPGELLSIMRGGDRSATAQPAPAAGLCLVSVGYPEGLVPGGTWLPGGGDWPA